MIITIPLLFAVFAFEPVNGARRWIQLGFASIQPSEIAKYAVVLLLAKSMDEKGERIQSLIYGVIPYLLVSGAVAAIILVEPNMSIASVIMMVTIIMIFVAGAKSFHIFGLIVPAAIAGAFLLIFSKDYRRDRFLTS